MRNQKWREEFISTMSQHFPRPGILGVSRALMRNAATLHRLAEESCNGHPLQGAYPPIESARMGKLQDVWDARIEKQTESARKRIIAIAAEFGIPVEFQGDPRGCVVKVQIGQSMVGVPS